MYLPARALIGTAAAAVLAAGLTVATPLAAATAAYAAEGVVLGAARPDAIAGSYIVTLKDTATVRFAGVPAISGELAARHSAAVTHVYTTALRGFSVRTSDQAARRLAANPLVARVEADGIARVVQDNPPSWGLDRIDQRSLPLNQKYNPPNTGSGVTVYVIDTGIRISHNDFGGRARSGYDFVDGDNDASDCHGHGTHVAGTVGGTSHGVAKNVALVAVRVLDCQGSGAWSQVIAGIDWVTANAQKPAVANMSLGGGKTQSLNDAVTRSVDSGVTYAVAAGNNNGDACNLSPASTPSAVTVGATESNDNRASYSNWGTCLDLFAPGSAIKSTWHTSNTATNTLSGTSMAAPHTAGAAALLLADNPAWTPTRVRDTLVSDTTLGLVGNPGPGSSNLLLYAVHDPGAPVASFTASCSTSNRTCSFNASGSYDPDGTITGYKWNFGDATTGTGKTVSHTYAKSGRYTVTLTVTDNHGKTGQAAKAVVVGPNTKPTPDFTHGCSNSGVGPWICNFYGTATDPDHGSSITAWAWNLGNGATSSFSQTWAWYQPGTYTVTLTVTDDRGGTGTKTRTIVVG